MYPLTDFSESKLRLMAELIESRLDYEKRSGEINLEMPYQDIEVVARVSARIDATVSDLEDMRTWVLTALQMVTAKETIYQS